MAKKTQNTQNFEKCPKSNKSVIFLMSKPMGTQILLVRGGRRSKKSILTDFEFLAKKISNQSPLQSRPKWQKNTKIPKNAKNGQIVTKVPFFYVLAIGNSNAFG